MASPPHIDSAFPTDAGSPTGPHPLSLLSRWGVWGSVWGSEWGSEWGCAISGAVGLCYGAELWGSAVGQHRRLWGGRYGAAPLRTVDVGQPLWGSRYGAAPLLMGRVLRVGP